MSQPEKCRILEVGIDYITATSPDPSSLSGLGAFGAHLVRDAVRRGSKRTVSRASGYASSHAEGVSVGTRSDGCLVRLSGPTAKEHWNQVADLAGNITRLDLAVTELPAEGQQARLRTVWSRRNAKQKGKGRPSKIRARMSQNAIELIEIGDRSSIRYCRIYDKEYESGEAYYKGALRWELETKAELAHAYANYLSMDENLEASIFATVRAFVRDRGNYVLPGGLESGVVSDEIIFARSLDRPRTVNRSIKFLNDCIGPLTRRLVNAGYADEVISALGLNKLLTVRTTPNCQEMIAPDGEDETWH